MICSRGERLGPADRSWLCRLTFQGARSCLDHLCSVITTEGLEGAFPPASSSREVTAGLQEPEVDVLGQQVRASHCQVAPLQPGVDS